jgi:hypothetical protein
MIISFWKILLHAVSFSSARATGPVASHERMAPIGGLNVEGRGIEEYRVKTLNTVGLCV